ncbi:DUF3137 domain-containing protein [Mycoplasma nasistruthionis]|uniref:DUF3137 domain-containing protein n=1 Tax=Mycoplasma nasistruthionis TaxID=353852 RepID=A0A5B7XVB6_9MOLU|nr:DUF3137 domain-containing protein [Mycoplasma nasistruthionis]QCZ36470.1 hypothetical protein FG904_00305 [Mycoplasma nasistruthionis]
MKRVSDITTFNEFKTQADEHALPIIEKAVNELFERPEMAEQRKAEKQRILFICLAILGFVLGVLFGFASLSVQNTAGKVALQIFGAIFLIPGIVFVVLASSKAKLISRLKAQLNSFLIANLQPHNLYKEIISKINPNWEYFGNRFVPDNNANGFDSKDRVFTKDEYLITKPTPIPNSAHLYQVNEVKSIVLDKKYPVHVGNHKWEQIIERTDRQGNVYYEKHYFDAVTIKVDIRALEEYKRTDFSMFRKKWIGGKRIEFENDKFNNVFNIEAMDELRIRTYFTVLAQENLLKLYTENLEYTCSRYISVRAVDDVIYFSFMAPEGFMDIDIPKKFHTVDSTVKTIYKDILLDIYTVSFMLQLVYVPVYLY